MPGDQMGILREELGEWMTLAPFNPGPRSERGQSLQSNCLIDVIKILMPHV